MASSMSTKVKDCEGEPHCAIKVTGISDILQAKLLSENEADGLSLTDSRSMTAVSVHSHLFISWKLLLYS